MHYIIYFDICAIIILLIILLSLLIRRKLKGRNNSLMFSLILLTLLATLGDLGFIMLYSGSPNLTNSRYLIHLCLSLYFLALNMILPVFILFIYTSISAWHMFKSKQHLSLIWITLTALPALAVLLNPINRGVFYVNPDCRVSYGPFVYLFHAIALVFLVWSVLTLINYRKTVRIDKMIILAFLFPMVIAAVLIQTFNQHFRIEMFGISIALMTFMITIQSSENLVDPLIGARKYSAGINDLLNVINTKKPSTILLVKIVNHNNILMYLGQEVNDHYLRILSEQMNEYAKQCHFDAELFYLEYGLYGFLSSEDDRKGAANVAEEIRKYLEVSHKVDDFDVFADARLCIIRNPDDFVDFQSMFIFATSFHKTLPDTKSIMYYADYKGRSAFKVRNDLDEIISNAISNDRFQMYYQPIYSTVEKRFVSAEALIRLNDREYGFISPTLFIPLAEKTGSIHAIGDWVLRDVFRFMSENNLNELGLKYIEINLSASQCIEPDLVDRIEYLLELYNLMPEQVSLELTETAADIDPEIVDRNVKKLHNMGIRFALDDYGTGYSNIRRVVSLPIDQVKLDKSFVEKIDDPQMWTVIEDTISMLKEMGKEVLIEGVETEEVAKRFLELPCDLFQGCEYIQGFYFCKPLPEDEFLSFIRDHDKSKIES